MTGRDGSEMGGGGGAYTQGRREERLFIQWLTIFGICNSF